MYRILYTQIIKYSKENSCAEPTKEEDLSLVTKADELLERFDAPNAEAKRIGSKAENPRKSSYTIIRKTPNYLLYLQCLSKGR